MNLNKGDIIKIRLFAFGKELTNIPTHDKPFEVQENNGMLGVDWLGQFLPLEAFSTENGAVVFESIGGDIK